MFFLWTFFALFFLVFITGRIVFRGAEVKSSTCTVITCWSSLSADKKVSLHFSHSYFAFLFGGDSYVSWLRLTSAAGCFSTGCDEDEATGGGVESVLALHPSSPEDLVVVSR